jgi:hypothetical protein
VRESAARPRPAPGGGSSGSDRQPGAAAFPAPSARLLRLDRLALELRVAHDRLTRPIARAAAAFVAARGWRACGAARLEDHARERYSRTGRWVRQLAELGQALERFPRLARALTGEDGGAPLGAESARLVGRLLARWESQLVDLPPPPAAERPAEKSRADHREDALELWIARARQTPLRVLRGEVRAALAASTQIGDTTGPFPAGPFPAGPFPAPRLDAEPGDEPRCLIEIRMPPAVSAAFEEVVDLYRALAGRNGSLAEALEALLAEALSGPAAAHAGDAGPAAADDPRADHLGWCSGSSALGIARRRSGGAEPEDLTGAARGRCRARAGGALHSPGAQRAAREARLDRAAGRRGHLPVATDVHPDAGLDDVLRRAESSLAEYRLLAAGAGQGGPLLLDDQLARLVALEDALMRRLGEIVLEFSRRGAWTTLGFASVGHYAESRLGLPATVLEDRVLVARRLASRPQLRAAYERGQLAFDALLVVLRTLGRGPVPDDVEHSWLDRAREATVKRLRDEARALARRALDLPAEADAGAEAGPQDGPPPHAAGSGPPLPLADAAWAASLRREPGLARRRVLQAGLLAIRQLESSPDVFLRLRLPEALADDLLAAIETARRGLSRMADAVPWTEPWPPGPALPSVLAARTFSVRARRVPSWVGLLALLEDAAIAWDDPRALPRRPGDAVYRRDGFRCTAPGCTARATLQDHHVVFRSRGGGNHAENRVALCVAHHAALHERGSLAVSGRAPLGLTWRLGPPGTARRYRCERRI